MSCRKWQTHIPAAAKEDTYRHTASHSCGLRRQGAVSCNLKQFRPRVVKAMRPNFPTSILPFIPGITGRKLKATVSALS